jgi:hypothetical protein
MLLLLFACCQSSFLATARATDGDVPKAGLVLWLDASSIDATDESFVSEWQDHSGRSNHVAQGDPDRRPVLSRAAIGGQPAIQFRGKELLECAEFKGLEANDQPFHIVIVFQAPPGGPPSQRLLDLPSRVSGARTGEHQHGFWVGFQGSRYIPRLGIAGGDEGEAQTPIWNAQPHVLELAYKADQQFEIHIDGCTERQAAFGGRKFLGFRQHVSLALGQHFAHVDHAPTFLIGDIAEVLVYQRVLAKTERYELGTSLSKKYSLKTEFAPLPNFERDIRPILAANCLGCHGKKKRDAGLDLRSVSAMLTGGEAGPVVVRGHPEFSELVAVLDSGKMPPEDAAPLTSQQIDLIRKWIKADAPTTEQVVVRQPPPKVTTEDRQHWAWQKPARHELPKVVQVDRVRSEIDQFVLARLEKLGLAYSNDAKPERLVRRLYFDLLGLPPSPGEVDEFLKDSSPRRVEKLVDQLLASHHFGERWGRHWLDVAGYVGVYGSDNDAAIIKQLPGKWRFRDYVIRSFNEDKPFDRFLIEQLAGDQLSDWQNAETFTAETIDALTATAFLLSANDDTTAPELNTPDVRHHVLQRTAENVASSLFAVTMQCCRCHDHKYEAISQVDYYRFQSIFAPTFNVRDWVVADKRTRPDVSNVAATQIDQHNSMIDGQIKPLKVRADQLKESKSDEEKVERTKLTQQIAELNGQKKSYGTIPLAADSNSSATTHVLRRGDYLRPGLEVKPELFEIFLPTASTASPQANGATTSRVPTDLLTSDENSRLALARAVTDSDSLAGQHVARVFVNRIWQQLFGKGLVPTSDNLGISGAKPSHPQLLDWLTLKFIEDGWRTKPLIRRMVLSSVYRQSATLPESASGPQSGGVNPTSPQAIDPTNRLLWRMNLRRLDSEQLRDAMLTVSGQLDRTPGGPPIPLDPRPDGSVILKKSALPPGTTANRRSVYILARRNYQLTFMRVFDQPIVARNCTVRTPSAVVTQSLALLHNDFVFEQAEAFAGHVITESADHAPETLVGTAWRLALGREPDNEETNLCVELLDRHARRFTEQVGDGEPVQTHSQRKSLARLCHMLLNTNEFLYVP